MSDHSDRRTFIKGAGSIGIGAVLAGCIQSGGGGGDGGDGDDGGDGGDGGDGTTTTATTTAPPEPTHVGMVYALGGLGDKSFNDMAHQGIQQAAQQHNVEFQNAEPADQSEFSTLQRRFAQSSDPDYDLICCIGFAQTSALVDNAPQFPDENFMLVDSVATDDNDDLIPNVANYVFQEHKGSFQVGYLAGMLTTRDFSAGKGSTNDDKVVGFVGGKEIPLIKKFQAGYEAGVKHADSSIEIRSAYAGDWSDPNTGQEIALSMYDEGADVIYHAAGGTGIGVFKAAEARERFAIGVDADQSRSAPEHSDVIVASMVKHVDTAVETSVVNVLDDNFQGGSVNALGLASNGVEAVLGQELGPAVPQEVKDNLDESRQAIIDGEISVPDSVN